jgi:hypothetical protein
LDLIKECVVERLPKFEDLPATIKIDSDLQLCDEAVGDFEHFGGEGINLLGVSQELEDLHDDYGVEFSCSVVADHEGNLRLGPIIEGDEDSVQLHAPLKRREMTTSSGLTVYRDDAIVAAVHTHGDESSFSLADIYAQFSGNNGSLRQIYVVRRSGVIDMAHLSADSALLNPESFRRLIVLWGSYLDHEGMFREGLSEDEYNEFIRRILNETLKIGFYTNEGSDDPAVLVKKGGTKK